ncbi:hypothetical protein ACFL42_03645 [Candidatus Omnitrophota bacterium]
MAGKLSKIIRACVILISCCGIFITHSFAAVGCTLNDPERDIKKIFPESTGYRTDFITIEERGKEALKEKVEQKLKSKLDPLYEALDVPYAYYTVLKGKEIVGRVHGVNQKGTYGGMQIILATDPKGKVIAFYYQKISSPEAKKFRDKAFTGQFIGMTVEDSYKDEDGGRISGIEDPSENSEEDFTATVRGVKKNLILLEEFFELKQ